MHPESAIAINLSFVGKKPTGLATYALNLIPNLPCSDLTLLASQNFPRLPHHYHEIPDNLTPDQGKSGHLRRLLWTQFQAPKLCGVGNASRNRLFFSPIPEAPLNRSCRSIVVVHDLIPLRFPSWKSPLTQYARHYIPHVLRQAQHIICNSTATAQDITRFFQIPATKITPIPLAHDAQHFRPSPAPATSPRPYFFYVGRPDPYKNLHRVIWALTALPPDYQLLIAGSGDRRYTPLLQTQIQELGLTDRVQFLDYVTYDQLPILYSGAIALVFPSLWEGFGFPVLEAMACGAPVITSNLSSLPEVAGDAAILVNPYDENAIAEAMQRIAMDERGRSQLRVAGLARASEFSWAKTGQATAEILQRFL
jgi:glycosyltransferase involved in cell wall biosynthesis